MNLHALKSSTLSRQFRKAVLFTAVIFSPLTLAAQQAATPGFAQTAQADTFRADETLTGPIPASVNAPPTVAPPPENEPVTQPHRFTPLQSFGQLFSTDDEKDRDIFYTRSSEAIAEFRVLSNSTQTGPLTRTELKLISDMQTAARADARAYHIPVQVAATLHLIAQQTNTDFTAMVTRLQENSGNVTELPSGRLVANNAYKFNVSTWLYLLKTQGPQHGLGFFANKIDVSSPQPDAQGRPTVRVSVNDPVVLRQLVALRDNPRINALMGSEYVAHEAQIPQTAYRGMNYVYNATVAQEQQALLTIGFDLGVRGADGIAGPLFTAAKQEFALMSQPLMTPGQTIDTVLINSARQAVQDAAQYSTVYHAITPATAFAVRHAARVSGMDFGYLMQLAGAESGFDPGIEASTSSATGLFQFIDNSWLVALYSYGNKYGLNDIVRQIEVERNAAGEITTASIADPLVEKYALSLRTDPRIMSLMGAEYAKENRDNLQAALPHRNITRADQYLAHFLGSSNAVSFIQRMDRNPSAAARNAFPAAAHANRGVFYHHNGVARSLREVYELFSQKFSSTFFDAPVVAMNTRVPMPQPRPRMN